MPHSSPASPIYGSSRVNHEVIDPRNSGFTPPTKSGWQTVKEYAPAAIIVLGLLVAIGGGIWAGAVNNSSLDISRFQPLHLATAGMLLATLGTLWLASREKDASKLACITTLLFLTTLFGVGAATAHDFNYDTAATWIMVVGVMTGSAALWLTYLRAEQYLAEKEHEKLHDNACPQQN